MQTTGDPILDNLRIAHLGSPKALLGNKGGRLLDDFREFALRGSMLDMAVGIIVGAAFGRVVSSFVTDILMPPDTPSPRSPKPAPPVPPPSTTASSSAPPPTS